METIRVPPKVDGTSHYDPLRVVGIGLTHEHLPFKHPTLWVILPLKHTGQLLRYLAWELGTS